ncbi:hypothetical protein CXG81DRAFT_9641 [Caulochytrium protostelioides]|uniref:RING-type domain-containing protein n=1 Tax=Caulochytrium protostelioides TaxID=1555241 RepID=A0A4P9XD16_9FUNG|nr:hypothetical protein CXG81DRAFT_9641 [Caulochytrium protostelioides]|eukprot:RKP03355.1 hypothetical protein CXG81DRAFT_9641 [Caulochytrium protostelioides]
MALILLFVLFGSQLGLLAWKRFSPRSFKHASAAGLWLVPALLAVSAGNGRFVALWLLFSLANAAIIRQALRKPLPPRLCQYVYIWFAWVNRLALAASTVGLGLLVTVWTGWVGAQSEQAAAQWVAAALIWLFYGLYFGTLGRDLVEQLSLRMVAAVGYYSASGQIPNKYLRQGVCAVCGDLTATNGDATIRLDCQHPFHPTCIKGWTIIGKRDACPYCRERVNLSAFRRTPLESTEMVYLAVVDLLRLLVVWNPIIILAIQLIYRVLGLK